MKLKHAKEDALIWLEKWSHNLNKTPHLFDSIEEMSSEAKALSSCLRGVACEGCGGFGRRTYATTATWRGGAGGAALTDGVCDKCWGSGRSDQSGPDLRRLWSKEAEAKLTAEEVERLREKLKKIHNLSLHAWEQVERNPQEAQELFKMICFHSK